MHQSIYWQDLISPTRQTFGHRLIVLPQSAWTPYLTSTRGQFLFKKTTHAARLSWTHHTAGSHANPHTSTKTLLTLYDLRLPFNTKLIKKYPYLLLCKLYSDNGTISQIYLYLRGQIWVTIITTCTEVKSKHQDKSCITCACDFILKILHQQYTPRAATV